MHNDKRLRRSFLYNAQPVNTIHSRHINIHDDNIRVMLVNDRCGMFTDPHGLADFTSSSGDSLWAWGQQLFTSLMGYLLELSPGAGQILENAEIEVLAARKMGDKVHIAYQLTLPTAGEGGMPFTQVTAQQMRKVDGKWRILFRLEGS